MNDKSRTFNTPILFLTFNRKKEARKIFDVIKQVRPLKLYIASDGPRKNNLNDKLIIEEIRSELIGEIDWECSVNTLFRDSNLGCGKAVSQAISWFFDHEKKGIILEDDCFPSRKFFDFCEKGLKVYEKEKNVFSISGTNLLGETLNKQCFSLHGSIWGWATWSNRWKYYSYNQSLSLIDVLYYSTCFKEFLNTLRVIRYAKSKKYNSWDYQWLFTRIKKRGLTLMPNNNLIENIGLENGTHHNGKLNFKYPQKKNQFLFDEKKIIRDIQYDKKLWKFKNK